MNQSWLQNLFDSLWLRRGKKSRKPEQVKVVLKNLKQV